MPKGQARTPEERLADALARRAQLDARARDLKNQIDRKAKADRLAEEAVLGFILRPHLKSNETLNALVTALAKEASLSAYQAKTLGRMLEDRAAEPSDADNAPEPVSMQGAA